MNHYTVFSRSCTDWKSFASAKKKTVYTGLTEDEARAVCQEYNKNRTQAQMRKGIKYEYTRSMA